MFEIDVKKYPNVKKLIDEGLDTKLLEKLDEYDKGLRIGLEQFGQNWSPNFKQRVDDNFKLKKLNEFAKHKIMRDYIVKKYTNINCTETPSHDGVVYTLPDFTTYKGERHSLLDMNRKEFSHFLSAIEKFDTDSERTKIDPRTDIFAIDLLRHPAVTSLYNQSKISFNDLKEGAYQSGFSNELMHGKKNSLVGEEERRLVKQEQTNEENKRVDQSKNKTQEEKTSTPEQDSQKEAKKKLLSIQSQFEKLSKDPGLQQFTGKKYKDFNKELKSIINIDINKSDPIESATRMQGFSESLQTIVRTIERDNRLKTFSTKVKDFLSAAAEVCKDIATGGDSEKSMAKLKESSSLLFRGGSKTNSKISTQVSNIKNRISDHVNQGTIQVSEQEVVAVFNNKLAGQAQAQGNIAPGATPSRTTGKGKGPGMGLG